MNITDVAEILNARRHQRGYYSAKCPAHKDKHPSLIFYEKDGKLYFHCKVGCSYLQVRAALGMTGGVKIEPSPPPPPDPLGEAARRGKIIRTWTSSKPITPESPAWLYLVNTRRVLKPSQSVPSVLRWKELGYFDDEGQLVGTFPVMLARLDKPEGTTATLHRTYLDPSGTKANVEKIKKLFPSPTQDDLMGSAIRLFDPIKESSNGNVILGITEGIETALACFQLFGTPTWAAWSSTGLARFVPPPEITDLIIFADNDDTGAKYANRLIAEMRERRTDLAIRIKYPKEIGTDFADELLKTKQ